MTSLRTSASEANINVDSKRLKFSCKKSNDFTVLLLVTLKENAFSIFLFFMIIIIIINYYNNDNNKIIIIIIINSYWMRCL